MGRLVAPTTFPSTRTTLVLIGLNVGSAGLIEPMALHVTYFVTGLIILVILVILVLLVMLVILVFLVILAPKDLILVQLVKMDIWKRTPLAEYTI